MYKKKKKISKKTITIISVILFLIVGFILNICLTSRELTIFEKAIKDSVLAVEKVIKLPIDFMSDKISENKEKNKMYEEYQKLLTKVEESEVILNENEELKHQLNQLQSILDINSNLFEYVSLNATVINRNLLYWDDNITIDKGEDDGVVVGMPVIVQNGLVGKVVSTSTFNSTIRLITNNTTIDKVSVKIKTDDGYIYGILNGYNNKNNTYIIEGISESKEVQIGSIVTTTGMGDIYPSGILIGKITGYDTDTFDLSSVLQMKSEVDFDDIKYVTLLKRNVQW